MSRLVGSLFVLLIAVAAVTAGGVSFHMTSAAAVSTVAAQHVYNTGSQGLWLHPDSPTVGSATSDLMPNATEFDIDCWAHGSNVNGDDVWDHGVNAATGHSGYASDFYIDTNVTQGNEAQQLAAQGVPQCGNADPAPANTPTNPQPAASVQPFVEFDRNAAKDWAYTHAEDTPPNDGSCTIFVSQALWAGGVAQTSEWNYGWNPTKSGMRQGTDVAWAADNFVAFMRTQPYAHVESLGSMGPANNDIPDAKLGDVIAYDWNNNNSIDHLDVITGFSSSNPHYPLVSGWSEDGANALKYNQRGWTYSELHHTWLQLEKNADGSYPNMNMVAYLIDIRSENDLNIVTGN